MMSPAEAFHSIRRLQIKALHHVNDVFAGNYRSIFKGKGLEPEDVSVYHYGDDIRRIDWNVTARMQAPYVKNFREERELTVMFVIDLSASSHFSHTTRFKSEMIAELAAILAFSAIKNQDKVGLILFTEEVELYLKPKKGLRHVLRVIRELLYFEPKNNKTNLPKALKFLGQVQTKRTICFLMSDFLTKDFSHQVSLISKRHDLIAFHVYDAYEHIFGPMGCFYLKDLETGESVILDSADPEFRENFKKTTQQHMSKVKQTFEKFGADYYLVDTGESSVTVLRRFFRSRAYKK